MSRETISGVMAVAVSAWTVVILRDLVKELLRLLESGSGLVAVGGTLGALAALSLGPPMLLVAGLLVLRKARRGRHAA